MVKELFMKVFFVICALVLFLVSYSSYLQSKKPMIKFQGKILKSGCTTKHTSSTSSRQKYKYGFSTQRTTYQTETECKVMVEYNKKDLNPDESGTDIIMLIIKGGPYIENEIIQLESIDTDKRNIKHCCTNHLINSIVFAVFGIIMLGAAIFAKLETDEF